ncbi:MAG: alpha/beta fold hydrolase [Nitriliruptoraceae bacterium]
MTGPRIHDYLEIRTAAPVSWSPHGRRALIATNVAGSSQIHRLDIGTRGAPEPVDSAALPAVTAFDDPVAAGYLPVPVVRGGVAHDLLFAADAGGNERTQLALGADEPAEPYEDFDALTPLIVDPKHVHRPGGVSRDGRWLAYATNARDGVAFDTHVRDLADGADRAVLHTGGWTSPEGFSPDGRYLAVSEPTTLPGDNRQYLVDLTGVPNSASPGDDAVIEVAPHTGSATVGAPSWLDDGSAYFFASDVGHEFTGICRATPHGPATRVIDTGWPTGCAIDWSGRNLLVTSNEGGWSRLRVHDPHTLAQRGEITLPGAGVVTSYRLRRDGRAMLLGFSSPSIPGDTWFVDLETGVSTRTTHSRCDVDPATFVAAEPAVATAHDGRVIPLFVFRPRHVGGRAPVVVVLHGGPESQYRPSFAPLTQYLVAHGFAVVAPNVRGSTGYGRTFQHLDDGTLRHDAIRDLAAVHDWIAADEGLDASRAALYGASYGGYLVLAGLAFQPDRWAAGVDIVGMSNLVTFLERTAEWRRAFREREYGSLATDRQMLDDLSPIHRVGDMRAPVFIIHGANDPRVPLHEAEQIASVLRQRGIRTELRVYDDEGHGLAKLRNRLDAYPRVAAFLHDVLHAPA